MRVSFVLLHNSKFASQMLVFNLHILKKKISFHTALLSQKKTQTNAHSQPLILLPQLQDLALLRTNCFKCILKTLLQLSYFLLVCSCLLQSKLFLVLCLKPRLLFTRTPINNFPNQCCHKKGLEFVAQKTLASSPWAFALESITFT